jgi:hypothetical protein
VLGSDLRDPAREVDLLAGDPLHDVLFPVVVAVDRIVAHELQIDVPVAQRHARVMVDHVADIADCTHEPCPGREVVDEVPGMERLGQLAPVGQACLGDLVLRQHVHARSVSRFRWLQ